MEEKQGISRLEQVVEEISEAERMKELRKEQKRLKKKARRKGKCKCGSSEKEDPAKQEDAVCVNGIVEEAEYMNGHEDSCEDDDDDGDSGGTPCSCEDLNNCERGKRVGYRNGGCG